MILVTGGAFQGKTAFARELLAGKTGGSEASACESDIHESDIHESDIREADIRETGGKTVLPYIADGRVCGEHEILEADILIHFHEYIKRFGPKITDPACFAQKLAQEHPGLVIVTNELGCGIVPMDAGDRKWREQCGRICTKIAEYSEEVYRVICGIACRLK